MQDSPVRIMAGLLIALAPVCKCPRRMQTAGCWSGAAIVAYGVEEMGGLIFAHLGPAPAPYCHAGDLFLWEGVLRDVERAQLPCNWLQNNGKQRRSGSRGIPARASFQVQLGRRPGLHNGSRKHENRL